MRAFLTCLPGDLFDRADLPDAIPQALEDAVRRGEESLVLGDEWYGLHFVLSGEVPFPRTQAEFQGVEWLNDPLEDALMGGEDAGIEDEFGGARFHRPADVARIAQALREVTHEELRESYDPEALTENDIPPPIWSDDPRALDWLLEHFERLVAFYTRCQAEGGGVLIRIA